MTRRVSQELHPSYGLDDAEIDEQFDLDYHLKHVDTIFKRVFGKS